MREVKFRGFQTYGHKWVYGYLVIFGMENRIYDGPQAGNFSIVRGQSVGQFTGLTDRVGKDIYEGDIVSLDGLPDHRWVIEYSGCSFVGKPLETNKFSEMRTLVNNNYLQFYLEGNIHENPELIK